MEKAESGLCYRRSLGQHFELGLSSEYEATKQAVVSYFDPSGWALDVCEAPIRVSSMT